MGGDVGTECPVGVVADGATFCEEWNVGRDDAIQDDGLQPEGIAAHEGLREKRAVGVAVKGDVGERKGLGDVVEVVAGFEGVDGGEIGVLEVGDAVLNVAHGFAGSRPEVGLRVMDAALVEQIDIVGGGEIAEILGEGAADGTGAGAAVAEEVGFGGDVGGNHADKGEFQEIAVRLGPVFAHEDVAEFEVAIEAGVGEEVVGPVGLCEWAGKGNGVGVEEKRPRADIRAVADDGDNKRLRVGGVEVESVGAVSLAEVSVVFGVEVGGEVVGGGEVEGERRSGGGDAEPVRFVPGGDAIGGGAGIEDGDVGLGAVGDAHEGEGAGIRRAEG